MKKIVLLITAVAITFSCVMPANVSAITNTMKERKEIIIRYRDESELFNSKAKNAVKLKNKPQKLDRKKIVNTEDSKLEIVETGENDNLKDIAEKLSKEPGVEFAILNHKIQLYKGKKTLPKDPLFSQQWGLENNGQAINGQQGKKDVDIDVLKAWQITKGSPNVVVGILDTGIDINHEDLKKNIFINKKEVSGNGKDDDKNGYIDDLNGWDFYNDDNTVYDAAFTDSHATHVAGIIAAENNKLGISGVAPRITVLPLKFIGDDGGYVSDAIEAIEYGKKMGVKIFNCSWSMSDYNAALELEMKKTDAVFVCAAGNYNSDVALSPEYPACFNIPNVISIAAIDNRGELAYFSNYGKKVDVAAPGVGIMSTIPENQYMFEDGTSMATPFVTGITALIKSKYTSIQTQEILNKLKLSVTKSVNLKNRIATGGTINAYNSLK